MICGIAAVIRPRKRKANSYLWELLETVAFEAGSDDFVFDNQMLLQIFWHDFTIAEVSCPTVYSPESSSIGFRDSLTYGIGCLRSALAFRLARTGLLKAGLFSHGITQKEK